MRTLKKITLSDYDIVFDEDLSFLAEFLKSKNYSQYIILADDNTARYCYPVLIKKLPLLKDAPLIVSPSGEMNKNLSSCEEIWAKMLAFHVDRKAVMLNLGGGVIGDMGGFVSACYKRGISFIQIPTTVLSQVDSSIGGKLGVDFKYGKNLIGVFKNPDLVLMSTIWLETLEHRQVVNGFAEIFKHALIQSTEHWNKLSQISNIPPVDFHDILFESLLVKKAVVEADPFEKGWRKILNFGHTIGHAIEAYSLENDERPLLHGEAIIVGIIMEAYIGTFTSGFPPVYLKEIETVLFQFFDYYHIPEGIEEELFQSMSLDKKNAGSKVLSVLLKAIGQPDIDVEITLELLSKALNYYRSLS
ncbi:MAG: 3-dehydroquinate synthase [Chitinophagales bacterium]|nr:3-dehydroquinate synthase [Chitinophagales bacterium]